MDAITRTDRGVEVDRRGDRAARGAAITVKNLVKTYGAIRAVDNLSFTVHRGEVFAILGPNGSGKTTTLETIEGYRVPNSGTITVLDLDPHKNARQLRSLWG